MTSRVSRRPSLTGRMLQLVAVMIASAGLAYGGSTAFATRAAHFRVRPLADVFSVLRHAHAADAAPGLRESIDGASSTVFAAGFPNGDSIYVATLGSGDICLVNQEPAGPVAAAPSGAAGLTVVACSHPAQAEQTGTSILSPATPADPDGQIAVLVPNGVQTVNFDDANGTQVPQTPVGNVAEYAAQGLSSVNFVAPGGRHVSEAVPTTSTSPSS